MKMNNPRATSTTRSARTMRILKKILLTVVAATIFWMLAQQALAAIQLDGSLKPSNLPDITVQAEIDEGAPETAATRTLIIYVGNLVSKVLVFAGAVSIAFLIFAGANYILAFGKDERIERGKRGLFWSIAGLLVILLSYAIVRGVISIIMQFDSGAA